MDAAGEIGIDRKFLLTPLREGRPSPHGCIAAAPHFYSRPCGRGDQLRRFRECEHQRISTHAPAGGATSRGRRKPIGLSRFLLTPLREGRPPEAFVTVKSALFLLTPLREGRPWERARPQAAKHFYSRPCGRGDGNFPQVRHEVLRQIAER